MHSCRMVLVLIALTAGLPWQRKTILLARERSASPLMTGELVSSTRRGVAETIVPAMSSRRTGCLGRPPGKGVFLLLITMATTKVSRDKASFGGIVNHSASFDSSVNCSLADSDDDEVFDTTYDDSGVIDVESLMRLPLEGDLLSHIDAPVVAVDVYNLITGQPVLYILPTSFGFTYCGREYVINLRPGSTGNCCCYVRGCDLCVAIDVDYPSVAYVYPCTDSAVDFDGVVELYSPSVCPILEGTFQADSVHSSVMTKILSAIEQGAGHFGIGVGAFTRPLSALSNAVGSALGVKGLFDQPAVMVDNENANAVVDVPQQVRSIKFHQDDWIDEVAHLTSDNVVERDLLPRFQIPTRIGVKPWPSSAATGFKLIDIPVFPGYTTTTDVGLQRTYDGTPLALYSTFYQRWRGTLRYTVEVVSTHIHQGQLFIVFNPRTSPASRDAARNCAYTIMDISLNKRFTMEIPFVFESDYAYCSLETVINNTLIQPPDSIGRFCIYVQNALTAPTTVAQTVDINIYISAGDDFEFAVPSANTDFLYPVAGVFQADDSVESSSVVKSDVTVTDPYAIQSTTMAQKISANVATADTDNIIGRDYIIESGIEWTTATAPVTVIREIAFPAAFWQSDFATSGLLNYHAFQHMDFEVVAKVNPSSFHAGMLIVAWEPYVADDTTIIGAGSLTQLPHCFIDVSAETCGVVKVPYSYYKRMMYTSSTASYGRIIVAVWNQLLTGTGQPQTLYVTVSARAVSPYVGVKQAKSVVFESSDASKQTQELSRAFSDRVGVDRSGYIKTRHMDVMDLMRRPDHIGNYVITESSLPQGWSRILRVPAFGGRIHRAIGSSYTYWTGTNKLWFVTTLDSSDSSLLAIQYGDQVSSQTLNPVVNIVPVVAPNAFNGVAIPKCIEKNSFVVDVPMYKNTPLVGCSTEASLYPGGITSNDTQIAPYVDVLYNKIGSSATTFSIDVYHSVSDDFRFIMRRTIKDIRSVIVADFNGVVPKMTGSNLPTPWIASGSSISSTDAAWWAFSRGAQGPVTFSTQTNRSITISGTTTTYSGALVVSNALPVAMNCSLKIGTNNAFGFIIQPGVRNTYVAIANQTGSQVTWTFDTAVTGGIQITALQLYAAPVRDQLALASFEMRDGCTEAGLLQTFTEFGHFLRDFFEGLKNTAVLISQFTKANINNIIESVRKVITFAVDFAMGLALTFACDEPLAKAIGTIQLTKTLVGQLAPKLLQPVFESQSVFSYVKGFISDVKSYLQSLGGFRVSNLSIFVEMKTEGKENLEYGWSAVEAVILYLLEGDKVVYDYITDKISAFVDRAIVVQDEKKPDLSFLVAEKKKIDRLLARLPRYRVPSSYTDHARRLDRYVEEELRRAEMVGSIPEPIGIYIHASSGVGKSSVMCKVLPALLMSEFKFEGDFDDFCVNTAMDQNGRIEKYAGQPMAIFDEFSCNAEAADAATVIRLISQFADKVLSSFLDDKGKVFKSRVLLALSNIDNVRVHSSAVRNVEALKRRFEKFAYTMRVAKVDLMERQFDLTTFLNGLRTAHSTGRRSDVLKYLDTWFDFHQLDIMSGIADSNVVKFSQFYERLVAEWKNKLAIFKAGENIYANISKMRLEMMDQDADDNESMVSADSGMDTTNDYVYQLRTDRVSNEILWCVNCYSELKVQYDPVMVSQIIDLLTAKGVAPVPCVGTPVSYGEILFVFKNMYSKEVAPPYPGLANWIAGAAGVAVAGVALASLVIGVKKLFAYVRGMAETGYSNDKWKLTAKKPDAKAVMRATLECGDERQEKIRKAIRRISCGSLIQACLFVDDRTIVVNQHFYASTKKQDEPIVVSIHDAAGSVVGDTPITICKAVHISGDPGDYGTDIVVLYLRYPIAGVRNIRHFIRSKDDGGHGKIACTLLHLNSSFDQEGSARIGTVCPVRANTRVVNVGTSFGFVTAPGDCGRPYLIDSVRPIIGIHSGTVQDGIRMYSPICIEMFEPVVDDISFAPTDAEIVKEPSDWWTKSVLCYGQVEVNCVPLRSDAPTVSQLVPMERHGCIFRDPSWECPMKPAVLTMHGSESALARAHKKYVEKAVVAVPASVHDRVCDWWSTILAPTEAAPLSMDDAINGAGDMGPLQWSTSAGWVGNEFPETGKHGLFEIDVEETGHRVFTRAARVKILKLKGKSFVDVLEEHQTMINNGIVPFSPWKATLKDEVLSIAKVEAKKSRIFEVPGLDVTLLIRKEFGQFLSAYKAASGFLMCHGIGQDKETAWAEYYRTFQKVADVSGEYCFVDLDYSNYDGSVCASAFDFFEYVTDAYYINHGDVHKRARHTLLRLIREAYIIYGKDLIRTRQGNKSGNPMTDVFNSLTNCYILHCAYMCMQRSIGLRSDVASFFSELRVLTYGDDVVIGSYKKHAFDLDVFSQYLSLWGYTVTDATKSLTLQWKTLEDIQFLKSKFVPYCDVILAPMPKSSIYKELCWEKKSMRNSDPEYKQKIEVTQQFMCHHGIVEYNKFVKQLQGRGVENGLVKATWIDRVQAIRDRQKLAVVSRNMFDID